MFSETCSRGPQGRGEEAEEGQESPQSHSQGGGVVSWRHHKEFEKG